MIGVVAARTDGARDRALVRCRFSRGALARRGPEYNPFKYNSFPANAGNQSHRVSSFVRAEIADAARSGLIDRLPPILAFQSIVDATVSTSAVVHDLFDRLRGNGHELVVFDINRGAGLEPYIRPADAALVSTLAAGGARIYRRTLITNVSPEVPDVQARSVALARPSRRACRWISPGRRRCSPSPMWPCPLPPTIPSTAASRPMDRPRSIALGRLSPAARRPC